MLRYSRRKEEDKEVKWGGTDSSLVGVLQGQSSQNGAGRDPLCFEIQTIRTEAVPHPEPS